ncbi:hypothetical protein C731_1338 [Mycolicibacterium hassiacum DSM 44199]|jgi:hypothetical protein|uniref:Uncharacterized protein n=1 Tax=Mycolicibacterium hassiacum (strain DSM 44199 / CIP 105218 / JCM 12690 / 3849) TaxID=1122247 RepID=K5BH87_MYCHD|nr:hypothetical protein C731_1338 [Mycolicibacterium hassiacum DSM 44199]
MQVLGIAGIVANLGLPSASDTVICHGGALGGADIATQR